MSTHVVPVLKIDQVYPHDNADALEIIKIFGYQCVVKKDQFKPNDLIVYIEPDYMVPVCEPEFKFLEPKAKEGYVRIKAVRLRGELSFGLVIAARPEWKEGEDVLEALNIKRYEPFIPGVSFGPMENEVTPPVYCVKYDMENYRRYNECFVVGEEVEASEKLNGCFMPNARVLMTDGKYKRISFVKKGDFVIGVKDGLVCEAEVLNSFKNGPTKKWLKICGERFNAGKGNSFFRISCTPEHKIYVPDKKEYLSAEKLKIGENLLLFRSDYGLSPLQFQVLLGKMLGDGSFSSINSSAYVRFSHKEEHEEYFDWTRRALGNLDSGAKENTISGYGTKMLRGRSVSTWWIKEEFKSFIKDKIKIVPSWVEQKLGPIGIAFWYMDDGNLCHGDGQEDRAVFATCGFDEDSQNVLIRALMKFDIRSEVKTYGGHPRLNLVADEAEKLFLLIAPYVPKEMQYKLPKRYRGHDGWLPSLEKQYKPALVLNKITSIEEFDSVHERYDLETTTHNYFVSGILVHNCNSRFMHTDTGDIKFHVGSHTMWKRRNPDNLWWKVAIKYDLENKLVKYPDHVFYGEVYGNVGGYRYGFTGGDLGLAFFDIMYKGKWLNVGEVNAILNDLSLPKVPLIYSGPWKEELIALADGPSTIPNANHIREGVVVKPLIKRVDRYIGRVILKIVSFDYLEGKKK